MVKKTSKKSGVSVNFKGVEAGGVKVPDGTYLAYPESVVVVEAESGNEMLKFKWKILGPKSKGGVVWDNAVLVEQSLWRLKTILELMGIEVPDDEMEIDPSELEGEDHPLMIEVVNEKYKGKDQPRIVNFGSPEGEEGSEDSNTDGDGDPEDSGKEDEESSKKPRRTDKRVGKSESKFKMGQKVSFQDDKGKTVRGTIIELKGDDVKVEDKKEDVWELSTDDLEAE